MASSMHGRSAPDFHPMGVAKMGFLVDQLNRDCSPLQFLRELTKNAVEAIQRLENPVGEIRWDVDWNRADLIGEDLAQKLCVIDTGAGMTGEEMVDYINKLSSSIHEQSATGNFGVGAKIAAAPLNPEGLVYLSWKNGVGSMILLHKDHATGDYGLLRFKNGEFWQHIQDDLKPEPIREHGTMVILLGKSADQATVEPPPGVRMPRKWILRYINSRFSSFPAGVTISAREGWNLPRGDRHNFLRKATGQRPWLEENSTVSGVVRLPENGANLHWWIIKPDADTNSGHYTPGGHVAALFQNELYELVFGPAGFARLQSFGVVFGGDRVVLYLEPDSSGDRLVSANTARTQLLIANDPLDWPVYATEFRVLMPQELRDYQDEIGSVANQTDHRKAIRERLKSVRDLFRFGRYRPKAGGVYKSIAGENVGGSSDSANERVKKEASAPSGGRGGSRGDIYSLFANEVGVPSELVDLPTEPQTKWVSSDDGSRSHGDLEDRAAKFLPDQNILLINADFRAFTDMIDRWTERYDHVPGCKTTVEEVTREWFEQQLIETVMSALALKQSGKWSMQELSQLWDDTALTACVLPRYHIDMSIKRVLGQKLGRIGTMA
ncbi:hypothetical protein [uncultured Sphingomonas sp.]|uniref:hypothetical protein n=1 Tax=uncultured Sphingomonas sp. TaxID=158754 RepID=UPI0035C9930D